MICSSLNRLFLTTPPLALAGHRKWRSHISAGLVFGGQVTGELPSLGKLPLLAESDNLSSSDLDALKAGRKSLYVKFYVDYIRIRRQQPTFRLLRFLDQRSKRTSALPKRR
jgi:hypothetical protein